MAEIELSPARIVRRFGPPGPSDDYKVSGEYVFTDAAGHVFVLHDWKNTTLWEDDLLTPQQFWESESLEEMCLSSCDIDTAEFANWLTSEV